MMSPWDNPLTFFWEMPTFRNERGHVIKTTRKPAFISAHKTVSESMAEGYIVCVRLFTMNVPPPELPQ